MVLGVLVLSIINSIVPKYINHNTLHMFLFVCVCVCVCECSWCQNIVNKDISSIGVQFFPAKSLFLNEEKFILLTKSKIIWVNLDMNFTKMLHN